MKSPEEILASLAALKVPFWLLCDRYGVRFEDAVKNDRLPSTVYARLVVWRILTDRKFSHAEIGRLWGMHHTSVTHAMKKALAMPSLRARPKQEREDDMARFERALRHLQARVEELEAANAKLLVSQRAQLKRIDAMERGRR